MRCAKRNPIRCIQIKPRGWYRLRPRPKLSLKAAGGFAMSVASLPICIEDCLAACAVCATATVSGLNLCGCGIGLSVTQHNVKHVFITSEDRRALPLERLCWWITSNPQSIGLNTKTGDPCISGHRSPVPALLICTLSMRTAPGLLLLACSCASSDSASLPLR